MIQASLPAAGPRFDGPAGEGSGGARDPVGVYVHVPFCASRCGYCDFPTTAPAHGDVPHVAYGDAVVAELEERAPEAGGGPVGSLYFGGGTPGLWDPAQVRRVVRAVAGVLGLPSGAEVTLEANPADVTPARAEAWLAAGVNRVSLGIQSLDDRALRLLGRRHDARGARDAVAAARLAGVNNLSLDIILGLPDQGADHHLDQLARLLALGPDHVSAYVLSLAPRSPLAARGLRPAPDAVVEAMLERGRARLRAAGFPQYEVSNYAPLARRSVHNTHTWAGFPYLGLGAFAHSLRWEGPVAVRRCNLPLATYIDPHTPRAAAAAVERVPPPDARFEALFLGLRTTSGVHRRRFARRFGVDPVVWLGPRLDAPAAAGLLAVTDRAVAPTPAGIWLADELALRLDPGVSRDPLSRPGRRGSL